MSGFQFVSVRDFTPNLGGWTGLANVVGLGAAGAAGPFALQMSSGPGPVISVLSDTAFRVRFNPAPDADLTRELSYAVVDRSFGRAGAPAVTVAETEAAFTISTAAL